MWMDRNDGDFWYRFRKAASDGGSCSPPIIASNVSHRVALDTTVFPLRSHALRFPASRCCFSRYRGVIKHSDTCKM